MGTRDKENIQTRRTFVKTAAYVAPAILTLRAIPAFATPGSEKGNEGCGNWLEGPPPGHEVNQNDPECPEKFESHQ